MPSSRSSSTARGQVVTDLEGRRYTLSRLIGQGGQGQVYEVKEGRLAVKLLRSAGAPERERLRRCIQAVKRLDLEGLPIASPIAVLRSPHAGYLMHLAAARMSSLRGMMNPPADGRSVSEWYIATGGLRARLRRLSAVFEVFARLHGRGLVYGDPSPQNILLSSDGENQRAFLIDADNLHVHGDPTAAAVFTPGYGAPELITGTRGPDTLTDAFALAVIAFELLTLVHPFVGDLVHDGEPELEEAAFHGRMPWIEHSSDTRNRCSRGIPRELVVSPEAKKLFKRMFEDGLVERLLRPGLGECAGVFAQASDVTVLCPRCAASYYAPAARECPWCAQPRPGLSTCLIHLWDPEITVPESNTNGAFVVTPKGLRRSVGQIILVLNQPVLIRSSHIFGDPAADRADDPLIEATWTGSDTVRVRNVTKQTFTLVEHSGPKKAEAVLGANAEQPLPMASKKSQWYLHFGPLHQLHRSVVFTRNP
jgi:DNA-binding helix-hairpin-helix protein with protein kinase domain